MLPEPSEVLAAVKIRVRRHERREGLRCCSGGFPLGPLLDVPLCVSLRRVYVLLQM